MELLYTVNYIVETELLLYPTFRAENYKAQLAARDSVFVELLESLPWEAIQSEQQSSVFPILSDLWLSRLNLNTVFVPPSNETISIPRFASPHLLDPVFEFAVLQALLRIVGIAEIDRE